MSLEITINDEIKKATMAGEKVRLDTLRSIKASIIEFNKSGAAREMNEQDETKLLLNAAKKRKDAIELYEKANRQELADKEKAELLIIEDFLPKQMSEDEIKEIVKKLVAESGAEGMKDMGRVMKIVMAELTGKAEGGIVQKFVREILAGGN
jgi:uncharacterized protein YqeY